MTDDSGDNLFVTIAARLRASEFQPRTTFPRTALQLNECWSYFVILYLGSEF